MNRFDIQGRFLGIPYDWRRPTASRIRRRIWNKGGPMFPPKVWGWGWGVNLRHPGTWALFGGLVALGLLLG